MNYDNVRNVNIGEIAFRTARPVREQSLRGRTDGADVASRPEVVCARGGERR